MSQDAWGNPQNTLPAAILTLYSLWVKFSNEYVLADVLNSSVLHGWPISTYKKYVN